MVVIDVRLTPLVIGLPLLFVSQYALALSALNWTPSILAGYGVTSTNTEQTVRLADTPAPGLSNRYLGASTLYGTALLGLAFENLVTIPTNKMTSHVGFELDYLRNNAVNGTVEPLVNVSPDFDELKYSYDIQSYVLQATTRLIKENLLTNIDGYLHAGIGLAVNRLVDYAEYSPDESTAAPMLSPFSNKSLVSPALSAGVGISHQMGKYSRVSLGYRFIYTGRAKFGKTSEQQTNATIELSPLNYQMLILELQLGQV